MVQPPASGTGNGVGANVDVLGAAERQLLARASLRAAPWAGVAAMAVGALVLVGHAAGVEHLYRPLPGAPAADPLAAIALCLLGVAVCCLRSFRTPGAALALAGFAVIVASFGLAAFLINPVARSGVGWNSVLLVLLSALSILLRRQGRHGAAQFAAVLALAPGLIGLTGLAYMVGPFVGQMAPPTILGGVAVTVGLILAGAHRSAAGLLASPWAAGRTARMQVALAMTVPFLFGLVMVDPTSAATVALLVVFVGLGSVLAALSAAGAMEGVDKRRRAAERQLVHLATRDALTGLANRRMLEAAAATELARADRDGDELSLAILDLDHFKALNDSFGHEAGDRVLRRVAGRLAAIVRRGDVAARWGGEEFVLLLPRTGRQETITIARRLLDEIEAIDMTDEVPGLGRVSASVGVAERRCGEETFDELLARADTALYEAKAAGRARVWAD